MRALENELIASGFPRIVGIDEAGRGCLAGPVVAAAVCLPPGETIAGVMDSKKLSPQKRNHIYEKILELGDVGIGIASPQEIDQQNILQATLLAMRRAVYQLSVPPDICLVDGNQRIPDFPIPQRTIVKGDAHHYLIAAASIVSKVYRDRLMCSYDNQYPEYGLAQHKGYPTKAHLMILEQLGPTPIHRFTFRRVKRGSSL